VGGLTAVRGVSGRRPGGGTIPLEAQRLGLEAHASDLNPVAVLINKALIEIPPKFAGQPPVNPGAANVRSGSWPRATGLADDVRFYGQWMRDEAAKRIGHLYLKATLSDGTKANVIAWIWARTVICPNPACGIALPLVRSWWLGKKKGEEAWVVPAVNNGRVTYTIGRAPGVGPSPGEDGTVGRTGARCMNCDAAVDLQYIRAEGRDGRMSADLMAVVAEDKRTRHYLNPTDAHRQAADVGRPHQDRQLQIPQLPLAPPRTPLPLGLRTPPPDDLQTRTRRIQVVDDDRAVAESVNLDEAPVRSFY